MRQIVLDTETTGLEIRQEHRIIEIGGVELVNRRLTGQHYHQYINPERDIDQGALAVHGITGEQLADKPRFHQIADEFLKFVEGAELIIHNAPFDVAFINAELERLPGAVTLIEQHCDIIDSLALAKDKHPGQRNSLDALCQRYGVDNSQRDLHGALLDAEILADVYIAMTGGQAAFELGATSAQGGGQKGEAQRRLGPDREPLPILRAGEEELRAHEAFLDLIAEKCEGDVLWRKLG